jgi:hypothetical protein
VIEPIKFDGFCVRTLEEDLKYEEYEKTHGKNKKPNKKK